MTTVNALVAKELRSYAVSPVLYVVAAIFLAIFGFLSYLAIVNAGNQAVRMMQIQNAQAQLNLNDLVFRPIFYSADVMLVLVLPLLTMRLFAEERKLRTFELLMTSPIGLNEIVAAKFVSVLIVYIGLLGSTLAVPLILSQYSTFDWNPVRTGYLALFLQGGLFLAVGVLASTFTENQIVAAFLSVGLILALWLIGGLGTMIGDNTAGNILSYLSFIEHYDRLVRGLLDAKDVVYYLSGVTFALFMAYHVIDSCRWR